MIIRYTHVSAIALLAALTAVACGGGQKNADTPASTDTMPSAEPPPPDVAADAGVTTSAPVGADKAVATANSDAPPPVQVETLSDEQIAGITDAANSGEIAQAKLAQTKSKDPQVKHFAAMMINHHGAAKLKQAKLKITDAYSAEEATLKADADSTLDTLKKDTGKEFDKAYIDAQVDGHQKVLDTINQKLPNVKNPDLKAYLDEIKPRVEQHLKEAKEMQQNFDSKSSAADGAKQHAG
jgi:putative membrane protein